MPAKQTAHAHRTPSKPAARTNAGPARMNQTCRAARGFEDLQRIARTHRSAAGRVAKDKRGQLQAEVMQR